MLVRVRVFSGNSLWGDADEPKKSVLAQVSEAATVVDTMGGRIHVRWDETAQVQRLDTCRSSRRLYAPGLQAHAGDCFATTDSGQ